jgi:hypothetical protein
MMNTNDVSAVLDMIQQKLGVAVETALILVGVKYIKDEFPILMGTFAIISGMAIFFIFILQYCAPLCGLIGK